MQNAVPYRGMLGWCGAGFTQGFFFLRRSCWLEFVWSEISPCLDSSTDRGHVSQPCKTLLTVPSETVHTSTGTPQSEYNEYKPTYIRRQVTRGDIFWTHQRHIKRCGSAAYPTSWVSSTSPPPTDKYITWRRRWW